MTWFSFAVQTLLVVAAGLWSRWLNGVRSLPATARVPVYFATGLVTLTVELWLASVFHIPWSRGLVLVVPLLAAAASYVFRNTEPHLPRPHPDLFALLGFIALVLFTSAVLSGAATSFDLLLFWGPKAQRFALARGIDVAFLANPANRLMHPDYPPLVPLYYAWTSLHSARLNWWGAVLSTPLLLAGSAFVIEGFARARRKVSPTGHATLFAALFGYLFVANAVAGNAEPALVFFEVLALGALSFAGDEPALLPIASIAFTGAVLTKVEGTAFVAATTAAFALARAGTPRVLIKTLAPGIAPAVTIAAWLGYCRMHDLLDAYRPATAAFSLQNLPAVAGLLLRDGGLRAAYAPWLVLAALIVLGRWRAALPHVTAAAAYAAFLLYLYSRGDDATVHVAWSAQRVLITPVVLLFMGALAADE